MKRAVVYSRVSNDRQEAENQLEELRTFVDRHEDWRLVDEYTDAESGASDRRSAFQRLLDDAHQRKFDVLVFWALDRFSRESTRATILLLHQLGAAGVEFVSYTERHLDSTGVFRDALIGILAALAKQEPIRLSGRVRAGMARARKDGKHVGRQPVPIRRVEEVIALRTAATPLSISAIAKETGLGRSTVGRIIQDNLRRRAMNNDELCPYFEIHQHTVRSQEIGGDNSPRVEKSPWCNHPKNSPVSLGAARSIGGGNKLQCEGDFEHKCPLTAEEFDDIE